MNHDAQESCEVWAELVPRTYDRLIRFLYRRTGCIETAKDLAQEAYTVAYEKRTNLQSSEGFDRWLFRIAHFQYLMWRRSWQRRAEVSVDDMIETTHVPLQLRDERASDAYVTVEVAEILDSIFQRLNASQREVWSLYHEWGCSIPDIAAVYNIAPNTAQKRVRRVTLKVSTLALSLQHR